MKGKRTPAETMPVRRAMMVSGAVNRHFVRSMLR
jgi:hypothetical protein